MYTKIGKSPLRMLRSHWPCTSSLVGVALLALIQPVYAKNSNNWEIDKTVASLQNIGHDIQAIEDNYTNRFGVIGKKQAEERFDRALTEYLLGHYKNAASEFYVLIETDALQGYSFQREAEWYLADSAFKIGQYTVLEDAAYHIIDQPNHLFFTEAVRLLLESYSLRGRTDKFQETIRRFVLSGQVESSDALNYSIGKSFYWQKENAKAKAALSEIPEDSLFYQRAQYFLGGVYVSEESFDVAIEAFQNAIIAEPIRSSESEINDLANLAIGRVYFERKEYLPAIASYQKIDAKSAYYIDALYETVWTFIGLEQWKDAIEMIDIFLIAYPEDENAIRFQNTLGDLYMKLQEHEKALNNYELVSNQLEPVYSCLEYMMKQPIFVTELLQTKMQENPESMSEKFICPSTDNSKIVDPTGMNKNNHLPEYITDKMYKDPQLSETIRLVNMAREQKMDVQNAQNYATEIEAVLRNKNRTLYAFAKDKEELDNAQDQMYRELIDTLYAEVDLLASTLNSGNKDKNIAFLQEKRSEIAQLESVFLQSATIEMLPWEIQDKLLSNISRIQDELRLVRKQTIELLVEIENFTTKNATYIEKLSPVEKADLQKQLQLVKTQLDRQTERANAILTQDIHNVLLEFLGPEKYYTQIINDLQKDADQTLAVGESVLHDVNYFEDKYSKELKDLRPQELNDIRLQLQQLQVSLQETNSTLEYLGSETAKNVLLATQNLTVVADDTEMLSQLQNIHNALLPYWNFSSMKNDQTLQQRIDYVWLESRKMQQQILNVYKEMDGLEDNQRVEISKMLRKEQEELAQFSDDVIALSEHSEQLGMGAAFSAFEHVALHVEERMLGADMGIVKVYWIRKTDIEDEILRLQTEQAVKTADIQNRFTIVSSKLSGE